MSFFVYFLRQKYLWFFFQILLENRELRQCLAEHQTVLEMVMNKFRRVSAHAARLERDYSTMADQNGLNEIKVDIIFDVFQFKRHL